jgi:hypothetical protein
MLENHFTQLSVIELNRGSLDFVSKLPSKCAGVKIRQARLVACFSAHATILWIKLKEGELMSKLVNCKTCKAEISKKAKFCPKCGNPNKRVSKIFIFFIILIIWLLYTASNRGNQMIKEAQNRRSQNQQSLASNNTVNNAPVLPVQPAWIYDSWKDDLGRGEIKQASIFSINMFEFAFPYAGLQNAELILRKHPEYGNDVILKIKRGQFLCNYNGCSVNVKFSNQQKPITFSAVEPADNSSETIFIRGFDRFLANLKNSETVKIEATIYQEGSRVFEFNTKALKW